MIYDPNSQQLIAAWSGANSFPYYATFNGINWVSHGPINRSTCVLSNISLCYDPISNQIIAAWIDTASNAHPQYATFDGNIWSAKGVISEFECAGFNISTCHNKIINQIISIWTDINYNLRYSLFDGKIWHDQEPTNCSSILFDINCCSFSNSSSILATWRKGDYPYFSIFNGTTWADALPISNNKISSFNISCSFNNLSHLAFAFFSDELNYPAFSIFDGHTWSNVKRVTELSRVGRNILATYSPKLNQTILSWTDLQSHTPHSALIDEMNVQNYLEISVDHQTLFYYDETSVFFNPTGTVFASWIDSSGYPFFSSYGTPTEPPTHFEGYQIVNDFGLTKEYTNVINWTPSTSNDVVGYEIFKDNLFIKKVNFKTFKLEDHNQPKNKKTTYSIYAINLFGGRSSCKSIII